MRTKTLLCFAALTAAGVTASMAQSSNVYSLNIVGYVTGINAVIGGGNDLFGNPLNVYLNGRTNSAADVLNIAPFNDAGGNPGLDAFYLSTWNGGGFDTVYYEQVFTDNNTGGAVTNGWATDGSGSVQAVIPTLTPGIGFFINNGGPTITNVFVGEVDPLPGQTNHNIVGAGNVMLSSRLAVGNNPLGDPAMYQLPLAALADGGGNPGLDAFYFNTWNGGGYDSVYYEQVFTSNNTGGAVTNGWATDGSGSVQGFFPALLYAEGFFINNGGPIVDWTQTITNSP